MIGLIDRSFASEIMAEAGVTAMVVCEPEGFHYVTGVHAGPAAMFRRAGSAFAVIPADTKAPIGAVATDLSVKKLRSFTSDIIVRNTHAWIEMVTVTPDRNNQLPEQRIEAAIARFNRPAGFARPETFDFKDTLDNLLDLLAEMDLRNGALAFDLAFVPVADMQVIAGKLTGYTIRDGSPMLDRLRAIKSEREIELLRTGLSYSETGLEHIREGAGAGMSQSELIALYRDGVSAASRGSDHHVSTAEYVAIGPENRSTSAPIEVGDSFKCDVTCTVDGYTSDMCRNFVFGAPNADQVRLHAIAENAFQAGMEYLRPGCAFRDVYRAAAQSLADQGLPSYSRGHFGHSVGQSVFVEQWPFVSANNNGAIESNMVIAFEVPIYVEGIASYNIEDQFVITPNGAQSMNRLPTSLIEIG